MINELTPQSLASDWLAAFKGTNTVRLAPGTYFTNPSFYVWGSSKCRIIAYGARIEHSTRLGISTDLFGGGSIEGGTFARAAESTGDVFTVGCTNATNTVFTNGCEQRQPVAGKYVHCRWENQNVFHASPSTTDCDFVNSVYYPTGPNVVIDNCRWKGALGGLVFRGTTDKAKVTRLYMYGITGTPNRCELVMVENGSLTNSLIDGVYCFGCCGPIINLYNFEQPTLPITGNTFQNIYSDGGGVCDGIVAVGAGIQNNTVRWFQFGAQRAFACRNGASLTVREGTIWHNHAKSMFPYPQDQTDTFDFISGVTVDSSVKQLP